MDAIQGGGGNYPTTLKLSKGASWIKRRSFFNWESYKNKNKKEWHEMAFFHTKTFPLTYPSREVGLRDGLAHVWDFKGTGRIIQGDGIQQQNIALVAGNDMIRYGL